jgi:hypothetical protein
MTLRISILPLVAAALLATAANDNTKTTGTPKEVTPVVKKVPGTPTVTNIMAGQTILAGTVTVVDDQDLGTLTVTYQLNNGWYLKETHLYAGTVTGIPVGGSGNPRPGQFPHKKTTFAAGTQTYSVTIPLAGLPTDVITLAAHAVVTGTSNQTGWGQGAQINDGGSWAMRFDHVLDVR